MNFTGALRLYAKYRGMQLAWQKPDVIQKAQLFWLLRKAEGTQFGREYRFADIKSVEEYQSRVPLRKYDDFWNDYWKESYPILNNLTWPGQIHYFTWSSGTTSGKRKYIPFSDEMHGSYNKAGTDLLVHHILNRPKSKVLGGKSFMLSGTTNMSEEAPGVLLGEVSGVAAKHLPFWAKQFFFPPRELSDIADWMDRTDKIAAAARGQDIRVLGGMPSWLLILLEKFPEYRDGSDGLISRLFPNLEMFVHGGVKFDPYLKQYQRLLQGGHAELREVYPASEGFFGVADRGYGEGLRLILDNRNFYEFVPVEELDSPNPTRHWIANVEKDLNYAIVLTTCWGGWSYIIGDTVRFVDTVTPRVLITGRTSYGMSAFGEHLIQEEIEKAVQSAANEVGGEIVDYALGVNVTGERGDLGHHVYVVEFAKQPLEPNLQSRLAAKIDEVLLKLNDDYADHRNPGCGLNPPQVFLMPTGGFMRWMASRGKLGDQHKVPRVINDQELFHGLVGFIGSV